MKLHARVMPVQMAEGSFGVAWSTILPRLGINSYEDLYVIWSQIDRFWIDAARQGLSRKAACAAWADQDKSAFLCPEATAEIGAEFVRIVKEFKLTFGEAFGVLAGTRSSDVKYHIRQERHPNSDKSGGIA
ncbi:hypothetical protein ABH908_000126 [Pseudomonas frederiksbergensis]|uniref:hypothetical protein n=1 Tax=Pseudomonas TaxID=286 RepID=UPI003D1CCE38